MNKKTHFISAAVSRSGRPRSSWFAWIILFPLLFSGRLSAAILFSDSALPDALFAAVPTPSGSTATLHGNPYVPAGAQFEIIALQGIDAANTLGKSGFSPQVNTDFEFTPSIGVSYDAGAGKLINFGLGLYSNAQKQTQSTGLQIHYNVPVIASSVTITLEDFDLKTGATGFDYAKKVAPMITLLGPGNTSLAAFGPTDIFPVMVEQPGVGKGGSDIWNISLADLLSSLHLADAPITGFILSADMTHGETANSDPYLLLAVGSGVNVPEPAVVALLAAGGIFFCLQRVRRQS